MLRVVLLVLVMAAAECAWGLYAARTEVNLGLFYGVLVAASLVFFVPGVYGKTGAKR
jgi:hypothetical protein